MLLRRLLPLLLLPATARGADGPAREALRAGGIVLFRHAIAPGGGDPAGMRLGECATQRNLDARGRAQAVAIGATLRGIEVGQVRASLWCRTLETAELAFPGRVTPDPAFNSFFGDRAAGPALLAAGRAVLEEWRGPGALVVVTHQVNITGLTGIFPASGEGVVLRQGSLEVAGRLPPP